MALTALRLASFDAFSFSTNPTLAIASYVCWTQAELSYAIMAATIPTARKLMLSFITYYNGGGFSTIMSGGVFHTDSATITPGPSKASRSVAYRLDFLPPAEGRSRAVGYSGAVERGGGDDDTGSQEMIIRKETTVEVAVDETSLPAD